MKKTRPQLSSAEVPCFPNKWAKPQKSTFKWEQERWWPSGGSSLLSCTYTVPGSPLSYTAALVIPTAFGIQSKGAVGRTACFLQWTHGTVESDFFFELYCDFNVRKETQPLN